MNTLRIIALVAAALILLVAGAFFYFEHFANPRVTRELIDDPTGQRAERVMLVTLPSGRQLPVNYLREGDRVYAAADGGWWKELVGDPDGYRVELLVRGEALSGSARAVLEDPDYTKAVFARLRPDALPGFGTLIEILLDSAASAARD